MLFLNILLLILKIIGIIILAVLLLIIGLLSIVLFVPIHYESQYEYYENLNGFCNVNWLFKIFAFNLKTVDGETDYDIKMPLWIDKLLSDDEEETSDKSDNEVVYKIESDQNEYFDDEITIEDLKDKAEEKIEKTVDNVVSEVKEEIKEDTEKEIVENLEDTEEKSEKSVSGEKVINFIRKKVVNFVC